MLKNAIVDTTTDTVLLEAITETATTVIYFCNVTGTTVELTVKLEPAGETPLPIYKDVSIGAGDTFVMDAEKILLKAGDKILALATAPNSIHATVSYVVL